MGTFWIDEGDAGTSRLERSGEVELHGHWQARSCQFRGDPDHATTVLELVSCSPDAYQLQLFEHDGREVFVRRWASGQVDVCTREAGEVWGAPMTLVRTEHQL